MKKTETLERKILSADALDGQLEQWRLQKKRIVFTNGCFDILHLGHIDYLSKASDLGDVLIVGLNSDISINNIKGAGRPITDEKSRAFILASLFFIDSVVLFDDDTPLNLISRVKPDILVKGNDYKLTEVVGYDVVLGYGGEVKTLDLVPGYSTSLIEKKIREMPSYQ